MQKLTHQKKQRASFILQFNVDDNLNFFLFFTVKICNTCKIVLCLPFRTSVGDVYRRYKMPRSMNAQLQTM